MKKPFMLRPAGIGLLVLMLVLAADQLSKFRILYGLDLPDRGSVRVLPLPLIPISEPTRPY